MTGFSGVEKVFRGNGVTNLSVQNQPHSVLTITRVLFLQNQISLTQSIGRTGEYPDNLKL